MRYLTLSGALALAPTLAIAGPFGIDFSDFDLEELGCVETKPNKIECQVPRQSRDFDSYVATMDPDGNLCKFTAYGPFFVTDPEGVEARTRVDELVKTSTGYYGAGEKQDRIDPESSLKAPDQWSEALSEGERSYGYWFTPDEEVEGIITHHIWVAGYETRYAFLVAEFYAQPPQVCNPQVIDGF